MRKMRKEKAAEIGASGLHQAIQTALSRRRSLQGIFGFSNTLLEPPGKPSRPLPYSDFLSE